MYNMRWLTHLNGDRELVGGYAQRTLAIVQRVSQPPAGPIRWAGIILERDEVRPRWVQMFGTSAEAEAEVMRIIQLGQR